MVAREFGVLCRSRRFGKRRRKGWGSCGRKRCIGCDKKELEEVDLGSGSQEPRPISISASLTEKKKSELILLLKEFNDVFA